PVHRDGGGGGGGDCGGDGGARCPRREFGVCVSQYPPGQQPQYPQQQGYPQQGQYPQQYPAPYSPYQMPQVHPMAYAQAQVQGLGWQFSRAGMMLIITGSRLGLCGLECGAVG